MAGFGEDPLTGDWPTRGALAEEDEAAAEGVAASYAAAPEVEWRGPSGTGEVAALVLLLGPAPAALGAALFGAAGGALAGAARLPALAPLRSPLEEEYGARGARRESAAALWWLPAARVAVAAAPVEPAPEQADAWAAALLAALRPAAVAVAAPLPAADFRGAGDAAEEDLVFELRTAAAGGAAAAAPPLPPGTLAGGGAAAALARCALADRPCLALLQVEHAPAPDAARAAALAAPLLRALAALGAPVAAPPAAALHAALAAAADSHYRASAAASMFV
jgi:hypothetical protein